MDAATDHPDAVLARLVVYPVKSLDPHPVDAARIGPGGALAPDRRWAMVDADGNYVNGKRERAVHRLRSSFDPEGPRLTLRVQGEGRAAERTFHLDDDRDALDAFLTDYVGYEVRVVRDDDVGHPDDTTLSGPTVVSTATLREVASWFDGVDLDGARRRFRANLELGAPADGDDLPPFWEDRLLADHGRGVAFDVGGATLVGVNPCQRCVVPSRDPDTGAELDGFRGTFVRRREATMPAWSDGERFDHYFRLMVNTHVPGSARGETLRAGDGVTVLAERELDGVE